MENFEYYFNQKYFQLKDNDLSNLSERDILNFRTSSLFQNFMDELLESSSINQIESYIRILNNFCINTDFSYQFGDFGGHLILKRWMRDFPDLSDNIYELITTITTHGCQFPMSKNILHKEHIMIPLSYEFIKQDKQQTFHVLLRQIPLSMHGEGQIAVGYIIWSAAVILSRWICKYTPFFHDKSVLEIGAGTGLCGIVAAACGSKVTITDYTDIILKNISQNIKLNTGSCVINGTSSCLNDKIDCQVYHLDWNILNEIENDLTDPIEKHKLFSSYPTLPLTESVFFSSPSESFIPHDEKKLLYYDIIIASDMVCCESDAVGVTTVLKRYLNPKHGIAIFVVPNPYHRYGIATLIPCLQYANFHLIVRSISNSQFTSQSHSSILSNYNLNSKDDISTILSQLNPSDPRYNLIFSLSNQDDPEIQQENDYLTDSLKEIDYFEWLLIIALSKSI